MFQLNNHLMLTLYSILLYFIINYLCNNNKLSSKFMKMFNIKNKFVMKIVCLALFAITFYFISKGMIKQGFKVGGQQEQSCELPDTISNGEYSDDCLNQAMDYIVNGVSVRKIPHNTECDILCNAGYTLTRSQPPTCVNGTLNIDNVECMRTGRGPPPSPERRPLASRLYPLPDRAGLQPPPTQPLNNSEVCAAISPELDPVQFCYAQCQDGDDWDSLEPMRDRTPGIDETNRDRFCTWCLETVRTLPRGRSLEICIPGGKAGRDR